MTSQARFPRYGYLGLLLIATGWPLAWLRPDGWQWLWENGFLLLWIGYNLLADALNFRLNGTSLMRRSGKAYLGMFVLSIPLWWLFEFFNLFLQNWHYLQSRPLGPLEYAIRASIHFSIVIPAVISTAELWKSTGCFSGLSCRSKIAVTNRTLAMLILTATGMMLLVVSIPRVAFPLVWICLYLLCDSVNVLLGAPSLLRRLEQGDLRPFLCLACGALTCGFFWEMWNYYSLPKWYYTIPYFDAFHVFEMPILGYLGYLPFGLEVYAVYHLLIEIGGLRKTGFYGGDDYVRL